MPYPDLITQSQAIAYLKGSLPPDQSAIPIAISAASQVVQRYLQRVCTQRDYIEIKQPRCGQFDKAQPDIVDLSFFPVQSSTLNPVVTIRSGRTQALLINNTNTTTAQAAWFSLVAQGDPELGLQTNVGLSLTLINGGATTTNSFPFFQTPTSTGFSVAASGTTGTLTPGVYLCAYSLVNAAGESVISATVSATITAGQTLNVTLPPMIPQAASFDAYVSTPNGNSATLTRQNTVAIVGSSSLSTPYTVSSLISGAAPQTTSYGTLSQLAAGISALGNGWSATVQSPTSFQNWPSADVWAAQGATVGALSTGQNQGLDVFAGWVVGSQVDVESGTIYLPPGSTSYGTGPGNAWQWPGSSDWDSFGGSWQQPVLVKYAGGWPVVPEPIQLATLLTVQSMIADLQTVSRFKSETVDKWRYELAGVDEYAISASARRLLAPYRVYRV